MKLMLKRTLVILMIIFVLLPTLFSGFAFAETSGNLNTERAGNFAANFAINFYENWSSINVVEVGNASVSSGGNQEVLDEAKEIFTNLVNYHHNVRRIPYVMSTISPVKIATDLDSIESIDCSSFTSAVLYKYFYDNQSIYGDTYAETLFRVGQYTGAMKANCESGAYVSYGLETYKNHNGITQRWNGSKFVDDTSLATGVDFLQPGDIVVFHGEGENEHQHTNVFISKVSDDKYLAYDCGTYEYNVGWWNKSAVVEECLPDCNNMWQYDGAYVIRVPGGNNGAASVGTKANKKFATYGEIRTEYDETVNPTAQVEEELASGENYKFNNLSWIGFVYSNSLFNKNVNKILKGTGDIVINDSNFDDKTKIDYVKEDAKNSETINITKLVSEGKILPGDILYAVNGQGGGEYLLYVGGTKIIYATGDELSGPSGALKYEYLEYYLKRMRANLTKDHEDDPNFNIPKYGITQVYRIKKETAESIPEFNANLIFNGKGYYTISDYEGIAKDVHLTETHFNVIKWIFDAIKQLLNFFISLILYVIRMQVVGWANLFENLIQHVVLGLSGDSSSTSMSDGLFGTSATSASGDRVTVESIFFNKIPILDANFFDTEHAGGYDLKIETQDANNQAISGKENIENANVVLLLRENLRTMYIVIRNVSMALLLFALLYMGIKIAISASVEQKAKYKSLLVSWVVAMLVVAFIHIFMYAVFELNSVFVGLCSDWAQNAANQEVSGLLSHSQYQEELSLYDAIRIKAYVFNWKEGLPATIIYVYMVYLMIRFLLIYLKRYLTIYILALSGSFMGVKYAFDKMLGRKTTALNKWMKDFAFNVLLQTVHAFIYMLFMSVALAVSQESIAGAIIALVILNFMLKADSIIIQIFGLNKAGSLADVNRPERWGEVFKKFLPMYTITRGAYNLTKGIFFGKRGLVTMARLSKSNSDNMRDALKDLEKMKYQKIGDRARRLDKLISKMPIKSLFKYHEYNKLLGDGLSSDTNKKIYAAIKQAKKLNRQRFTRKVAVVKDMALGTFGTVAGAAVAIADPSAGLTMIMGARGNLKKYKSASKMHYKSDVYAGKAKEARDLKKEARKTYNTALNTYTDNEYDYQEKYRELLDQYRSSAEGSAERDNIKESIKELRRLRKKERAKELHSLQEADEALNEAKINYGNAKHEKNNKFVGKAAHFAGSVTGLSKIEDMAKNDARQQFKAYDSAAKQESKLKDLAKVAKVEKELGKLTKELKEKYKEIAKNSGNDIKEEDAMKMFKNDISRTNKQAEKVNISSSQINRAINQYLLEHRTDKVTDGDVNAVLENLQQILRKSHKNVTISNDVRDIVRKDFEEKMISENKGLGFDNKDAIASIKASLSKEKTMDSLKSIDYVDRLDVASNGKVDANDIKEIQELHQRILHKLGEINSYNQIGKVKHKGSLVSTKKIIKDAKKQ